MDKDVKEPIKKKQKIEEVEDSKQFSQHYDPLKREPLYAHADSTPLWELHLLQKHYHPTIQRWATLLIQGMSSIEYQGDPLMDFSMANFLERISFKNPKSEAAIKKAIKVRNADVAAPANKERSDKLEEQFFNKYFEGKEKIDVKKGKPLNDEEMSDIADEVFRKEMELMIGKADVDESVDLEEDGEGVESEEQVSLDEDADMIEGFGEEGSEEEEVPAEGDFFDAESDLEEFQEAPQPQA